MAEADEVRQTRVRITARVRVKVKAVPKVGREVAGEEPAMLTGLQIVPAPCISGGVDLRIFVRTSLMSLEGLHSAKIEE